jgi:hypothetical protein
VEAGRCRLQVLKTGAGATGCRLLLLCRRFDLDGWTQCTGREVDCTSSSSMLLLQCSWRVHHGRTAAGGSCPPPWHGRSAGWCSQRHANKQGKGKQEREKGTPARASDCDATVLWTLKPKYGAYYDEYPRCCECDGARPGEVGSPSVGPRLTLAAKQPGRWVQYLGSLGSTSTATRNRRAEA